MGKDGKNGKNGEPLRLEYIDVDQLADNPSNWRTHPGPQMDALAGLLGEVGWAGACLYNERTERLIDGHARKKVSKGKVPVLIGSWSEADEKKILASLDPLAAMAEANTEALGKLLHDVQTDNAGVQGLLDGLAGEHGIDLFEPAAEDVPEAQVDRADELQKQWKTEPGQIWVIPGKAGEHRLLCGDSTKREDVERIGVGNLAVVSDPPYGIGVDTSWLSTLNVKRGKPACKSDDQLAGDDGSLDLSGVFSRQRWVVFGFPYLARDEAYTGLLVWDKRGDGGEEGLGNPIEVAASNTFNGYRLFRCVWAGYVRAAGEKRHAHPTQKPVSVMAKAVELAGSGNVYDPFLGSGTTMVAAEQLGRVCMGIEIEPKYVAVCLQRMADMGLAPGLEN